MTIPLITNFTPDTLNENIVMWLGDVDAFLDQLPEEPIFDLVITSPPYNLGKEYESKIALAQYLEWQKSIIEKIIPRVKETGSICWQVGNYVENGSILPLDYLLAPIFMNQFSLKLRNRIVWHYGHGLHAKKRFSGRYELILWFTKTDQYKFNLDPVRIPPKYPSKKHFKGPKIGQYSSNPMGKNPEDVWDIPNVKSNHVEKTNHPCQFPVGLIERLILSMTDEGDLVFDPFAGVSSTGVAAALHNRRYWGCEIIRDYHEVGKIRMEATIEGRVKYRPFDKPIYDHKLSNLSRRPEEFDLK